MDPYEKLPDKLPAMSDGTEIAEFTEAKNTFSNDKPGQYFSALSNEANLSGAAFDWSAALVPDAEFEDLDPVAIAVAREAYKKKYPGRAEEVNSWDNKTFLDKAKLTLEGKITRTTLLLAGRDEVSGLKDDYSDHKNRITNKDENGEN